MYKRYEKYKDSGIEWIGEVPEHWNVGKLKYTILLKSGSSISKDEHVDNGLYPIYGSNGIIGKTNKYNMNKKNIIIGRVGASGELHVGERGWVTDNALIVSIINRNIDFTYLFYWLSALNLPEYATKTAQPLITGATIRKIYFLRPKIKEQISIASYLDQKTSEIDSLIADKEKLIQKLQEYKQSIITETVTKGLNPDVKMKDSGIEWIGKVPEHWKLYALKRIAKLRSGDFINSHDIKEDGEFPVYGGNGLRGFTSAYTHEGMFPLIGRQGALCGNINYAHGKFWASEHAVVVSPIRSVDLFWLGELLRAMNLGRQSMSAAQPGLSVEKVRNLIIPVPPKSEQSDIAVHLKNKLNSINAICETTDQSIIKLKQYRQSLIYEAVTGKIDVRDYQPERSEQLA